VIEVTREVEILAGKDKGKHSVETILYVSSKEMNPDRADWLLGIIREYWSIEGCLHQRLDVSAGEDSSRVRNRNSLLVLGILREVSWEFTSNGGENVRINVNRRSRIFTIT